MSYKREYEQSLTQEERDNIQKFDAARSTISEKEMDLILMIRKANEARATLGMERVALSWIFDTVKRLLSNK
jgi:hypothetical protein